MKTLCVEFFIQRQVVPERGIDLWEPAGISGDFNEERARTDLENLRTSMPLEKFRLIKVTEEVVG